MDQVEEFNPPPNFAKETDSRYASYVSQFGEECWELDALNPTVIAGLIRAEFESLIDMAAWNAAKEEEDESRADLEGLVENWDEVVEYLETLN
jgi:hypothetical protein